MSDKLNDRKNEMPEENGSLPVMLEIADIDQRVKNVEKITSTIQEIAESGFELLNNYLKDKAKRAELVIKSEEKKHARNTKTLIYIISLLFVLIMTGLFLKETAFISELLPIVLGIGFGSSITGFFKKNSRAESEKDKE